MPSNSEEWEKIAEQLINESDPRKIVELAAKLNTALEPSPKAVKTTDNPKTEAA